MNHLTNKQRAQLLAASIHSLVGLLAEAKTYLDSNQTRAAFGTLALFDEYADDLRAVIRLCRMAQRRGS